MPGVQLHPQPCVQEKKHTSFKSPQVAETFRHSLHDGFTTYSALSPVNGLCCHRHSRDESLANLTPASRRQEHTASSYEGRRFVRRITRLALPASHRIPRPTCLTIAIRPSSWSARRAKV